MRTNKRLATWAMATVFCAVLSVAYRLTANGQVPLITSFLHWNSGATISTQGGYLGWNKAGLGEADFQDAQGTGTGGFCWYPTSAASNLMCLDASGNLTAVSFAGPLNGTLGATTPALAAVTQLQVTSGPSSLPTQGAYIGWNKGLIGETDFFTAPGAGTGGFRWYNGFSTLLMSEDNTGVLTTSSFHGALVGNVTGNVSGSSGSTTGNAATASALAAAGTQCTGSYNHSGGVDASGNANCFVQPYAKTSSVTSTGSGANSTASSSVPINVTMPDTNYAASCTGVSPSGFPTVQGITKGTTSITVTIMNGTASAAVISGYSEMDCTISGS